MYYLKQLIAGFSTITLFFITAAIMALSFYPACAFNNQLLAIIPMLIAIPVCAGACDIAAKITERLTGVMPETGYLFLKN